MLKSIPITDARHELTSLPEQLQEEEGAVAVTRRGEPVMALMLWDFYEALTETLEILAEEDLMQALRESVEAARSGKGVPWEEAEETLTRS